MTNAAQANQPDNDTLDMHSPNLVDDNVQKIMALFPNCITEAKDENGNLKKAVDFDLLRQELSQSLVEGGQERYRLDWPGKRQAILEANSPIAKTLRPAREESVNFDTTENLFIEGDNLEALKLLQESYLGQVKMIYIDPPYNTGNDFIYEDDFSENTADFLERSEQLDEEGNRLVTNAESNGRFHSDWLTMMYSRLKLARNLLKDDGVIFISIDDNEIYNLRKICNEVFGINNFLAEIVWQHSVQPKGYTGKFSIHHNYILVFQKSDNFELQLLERTEEHNKNYSNPDNDPNGKWRAGDVRNALYRPNLIYNIKTPSGKTISPPEKGWRWSQDTLNKKIESGEIIFNEDETKITRKIYLKNLDGRTPETLWFGRDCGTTRSAAGQIKSLFESKAVFDTPKPLELLSHIFQISIKENDLVLDFFAGSSTTAHALIELNAQDNGNRKFIMVQLPEKTAEDSVGNKAGYSTIAEISKERIRRAGQKIVEDNQDKDGIENLDIGFRVLKIDSTNMKDVYYTPDEYLQAELDNLGSHIKEDRTGEDLLFQVMLDWGVPLSLPIESKQIQGSTVYYVGINSLVACFDTLTTDLVDEVSKDEPLKFVSSELAITHDQDKTNIKARFALLSPDTQVKFI